MDTATTEEKFLHAVELINNLPKTGSIQPSTELKLKFYSYFKQATEGPCSLPKPAFWDVVNKAKWDAWSRLGDMSKEEAMKNYVDEFVQILKTTPFDESAHNYVHLMGPYIDFAPKDFKETYKNLNGKICEKSEMPVCNSKDIHDNFKKAVPIKDKNEEFKDIKAEDIHVNGHYANGTTESDSDEFSDFYDNANGGSSDELALMSSIDKPSFNPLYASKGTNVRHTRGGNEHTFADANSNPPTPGASSGRNPNNRRGRASGDSHPLSNYGHNWPAGSNGGGRRPNNNYSPGSCHELNETLAYAVIRLQQTMDQVVNRLDSLEALLQAQNTTSTVSAVRRSFWSIIGIPPRAVFFILTWPFLVHWLMYIVIQKRRRRSSDSVIWILSGANYERFKLFDDFPGF